MDKISFKNRLDKAKIVAAINKHLEVAIRVFSVKRVTRSFNVRATAGSRKYEYLFPLQCLRSRSAFKTVSDADILKRVNTLLQLFIGTKNYHNFTQKISPKAEQAKRFMLKLETTLEEIGETKLVRIRLHGQSFLYHQIRKMVGSILQTMVLGKEDEFLKKCLSTNKVNIWLAPSSGLLLDEVNT